MEDFKILIKEAEKALNTADHLAYVTYPLIKDPKLIANILEHLYNSAIKGMKSVLYYDRYYKRIPVFGDDFTTQFKIFREKCARRYNIQDSEVRIIYELKEIVDNKQKSAINFGRNDRYVFFTQDYRTQTLSIDKVKIYITKVKPFIVKIHGIFK